MARHEPLRGQLAQTDGLQLVADRIAVPAGTHEDHGSGASASRAGWKPWWVGAPGSTSSRPPSGATYARPVAVAPFAVAAAPCRERRSGVSPAARAMPVWRPALLRLPPEGQHPEGPAFSQQLSALGAQVKLTGGC